MGSDKEVILWPIKYCNWVYMVQTPAFTVVGREELGVCRFCGSSANSYHTVRGLGRGVVFCILFR